MLTIVFNYVAAVVSMQVLIFNGFDLKMSIHAPNGDFLFMGRHFTPEIRSSHIATPKRHLTVQKHVIYRIDR